MKMKTGIFFAAISLFCICNCSLIRKKRETIGAMNEKSLEKREPEVLKTEKQEEKELEDSKRDRNDRGIHKMTCEGGVSSKCEEKECEVSCSDGGKVRMGIMGLKIHIFFIIRFLLCVKMRLLTYSPTNQMSKQGVEMQRKRGREQRSIIKL